MVCIRAQAEVLGGIANVYSLVFTEIVIRIVATALLMNVFITIFAQVSVVIETEIDSNIITNFTLLEFSCLRDSVELDFTGDTVEELDFVGVINYVSVLVNASFHLIFVIYVH